MNSIIYAEMDVHSKSFTLCCYTIGREDVFCLQKTEADYIKILRYLERVRGFVGRELEFIYGYEAGGLGYTLYHQLTHHNVKCIILTPNTISAAQGRRK